MELSVIGQSVELIVDNAINDINRHPLHLVENFGEL